MCVYSQQSILLLCWNHAECTKTAFQPEHEYAEDGTKLRYTLIALMQRSLCLPTC